MANFHWTQLLALQAGITVHHDYELVKVLKSLFGHEQEVLVIK